MGLSWFFGQILATHKQPGKIASQIDGVVEVTANPSTDNNFLVSAMQAASILTKHNSRKVILLFKEVRKIVIEIFIVFQIFNCICNNIGILNDQVFMMDVSVITLGVPAIRLGVPAITTGIPPSRTYAKINKDKIKKPLIFRIGSQQMLQYITTSCFIKLSHSSKIYCGFHFYKCFCKVISAMISVLHTCKN